MDLTNRALIICGALILMFVALMVILLAWGAPEQSINRISDLAGYLQDHNDTPAKLLITFGGLILTLLAGVVIVYEVSPPHSGSVRVQRVAAGEASIGTDEIVQRLEEELHNVPHLTGAQANVVARGHKAEVQLDLYVSSDADLTATSEEACRIARELVEQRIGVELDCPPKAQIHYRELRIAQPAAPASVSAAPPEATAPAPPAFHGTPTGGTGQPPSAESTHEASETSHQDQPASS